MALKAIVNGWLRAPIRLGPIYVVLVHNHAFVLGLGASLPGWLITAAMGTITVVLLVSVWRARLGRTAAPALVLAGALSNFVDRLVDGSVVDYLQLPGWPAFNLADAFILVGAFTLATASGTGGSASSAGEPRRGAA